MVDYMDLADIQRRLPHFLEEVYNQRRLHSSLGYMLPDDTPSARSNPERHPSTSKGSLLGGSIIGSARTPRPLGS